MPPPIPPGSLFSKELVNVPVALLYSRRKLFEKIMQHAAKRKLQNSIQATGDRMSVTPQQFGMQIGKQTGKQANWAQLAARLVPKAKGFQRYKQLLTFDRFRKLNDMAQHARGLGLDKEIDDVLMPELLKSTGTAGGTAGGAYVGLSTLFGNREQPAGAKQAGVADEFAKEKKSMAKLQTRNVTTNKQQSKQSSSNPADAHATSFIPLVGGAISGSVKQHPSLGQMNSAAREGAAGFGGGVRGGAVGLGGMLLGNLLTRGKLGLKSNILGALAASSLGTHIASQTSRENVPLNARALAAIAGGSQKQSSMLSVLGGLAGGGIGGLAGGGAGGILGALGGGALGGGPGAGIGLLAGGAAGLGAGAHLGSNIGSSIGKKKKKPESDEKEEKSEEKSENNNKEKEMDKQSMNDIVKNASAVLAQLRKNAADPRMYSADAAAVTPPMSGVAGAMQRVGNTSAKMPTAGVGVVPKMVGQNIGAAAPAVQAAGNKMVAGEKKLAPQATGGVPMFGMLPGLAGNLGRFLGGK